MNKTELYLKPFFENSIIMKHIENLNVLYWGLGDTAQLHAFNLEALPEQVIILIDYNGHLSKGQYINAAAGKLKTIRIVRELKKHSLFNLSYKWNWNKSSSKMIISFKIPGSEIKNYNHFFNGNYSQMVYGKTPDKIANVINKTPEQRELFRANLAEELGVDKDIISEEGEVELRFNPFEEVLNYDKKYSEILKYK